jgi:hypothetical protein
MKLRLSIAGNVFVPHVALLYLFIIYSLKNQVEAFLVAQGLIRSGEFFVSGQLHKDAAELIVAFIMHT